MRSRGTVEETASDESTPVRAYTFVDAYPDSVETLVDTLQKESGVVRVDRVASPPNVVVITEAGTYEDLVDRTTQALITVRQLTRSVRFLPVQPSLTLNKARRQAA